MLVNCWNFFLVKSPTTPSKSLQHRQSIKSVNIFFFWSTRLHLGVAHQTRHAGEALAYAHALFLVQEERVGLDGQVVLQGHFGPDQSLQSVLSLHQPLLQLLDGVLDLPHLTHESKRVRTKNASHC